MKNGFNASVTTIYQIEKDVDWLKSLRPQPHWKPSEEQMKALDMAIGQVWTIQDKDRLLSLYRELKKL